jgi:transcriptional regulator with XRE-family HTH domain
VLSDEEVKRRIEAARILRGITQVELNRLLHEDGFGKGDAGRVERGELPLGKARRDALCRHLRVPDRWLISEDVDEIVGMRPAQLTPDEISRAAELLPRLLAAAPGPPQAPDHVGPASEGGR